MGATDFHTTALGKTVDEAFQRAVQDALYYHGHGGYTGTIAEKSGYVLMALPSRVPSRKFLDWIGAYTYHGDDEWLREELHRLERERAPRGQGEQLRKRKAKMRKAIKEGERARARVPQQHRALVERAARVWDDKWGPALAFQINGNEAAKAKERAGRKGARDKVFVFCGLASC